MMEPDKILPDGLYAPGGYMCMCAKCGKNHFADKRAQHCADCTIEALVGRTSAHPVTVEMLDRAILDAQLRANENGRIDTPDEIRAAAIAAMKEME